MNKFSLQLKILSDGQEVIRDGIRFAGVSFIELFVDDINLYAEDDFASSFIYFDELSESVHGNGKYLIFTCACGIAEDGGWEGVSVFFEGGNIIWDFDVGNKYYRYCFDNDEYFSEIAKMKEKLRQNNIALEPSGVVFPEWFSRNI